MDRHRTSRVEVNNVPLASTALSEHGGNRASVAPFVPPAPPRPLEELDEAGVSLVFDSVFSQLSGVGAHECKIIKEKLSVFDGAMLADTTLEVTTFPRVPLC